MFVTLIFEILSAIVVEIFLIIIIIRALAYCYHDPSHIQPPIASFLRNPNPILNAFFDAVAVLTIYDGTVSVGLIPSSNTPYTTAAINTPSLPFSTPCNNSMTHPACPLIYLD